MSKLTAALFFLLSGVCNFSSAIDQSKYAEAIQNIEADAKASALDCYATLGEDRQNCIKDVQTAKERAKALAKLQYGKGTQSASRMPSGARPDNIK